MKTQSQSFARQGDGDGLCGIYCLVNAVRGCDALKKVDTESLLQYFLEAAHKCGALLPQKISHGYEAHELVCIFNEFAVTHDYPARATLLKSFSLAFPKFSFMVLAKRIFEHGGKIVIGTADDRHWLLAYTYDFEKKRFLVEDSNAREDITNRKHSQLSRLGVVIMPTSVPTTCGFGPS